MDRPHIITHDAIEAPQTVVKASTLKPKEIEQVKAHSRANLQPPAQPNLQPAQANNAQPVSQPQPKHNQ